MLLAQCNVNVQMCRLSMAAKARMEMLGLFKSASIHIDIQRGK